MVAKISIGCKMGRAGHASGEQTPNTKAMKSAYRAHLSAGHRYAELIRT